MDVGWYGSSRARSLDQDFPNSDLSERAANARLFIVNAEALMIGDRPAARLSNTGRSSLLKSFNDKGISTQLRSRSARSAATSSKTRRTRHGGRLCKLADRLSACESSETAGRGPQGHRRGARRGPRPVRRVGEVQDRSRCDRRGTVRAGDVGLRRGPRRGRARSESRRGPLAGARRGPRLPHGG